MKRGGGGGFLLPWTRSTLRWPQGLHYTSQDREEGPWMKHIILDKSASDVKMCSHESLQLWTTVNVVFSSSPDTWTWTALPPFIVHNNCSGFQEYESPRRQKSGLGALGAEQMRNFHEFKRAAPVCRCVCKYTQLEKMATAEVIVSWLKHEVIVTALNCFYASFYWPVCVCECVCVWQQLRSEELGVCYVCVSRPPWLMLD